LRQEIRDIKMYQFFFVFNVICLIQFKLLKPGFEKQNKTEKTEQFQKRNEEIISNKTKRKKMEKQNETKKKITGFEKRNEK
jgi:hypothetical protein